MQDTALLDAVERYLRGEMLPEEKLFFEHIRKTNPEVDQLVVEHAAFLDQLSQHGEIRKFKTQLNEVYQQLSREGTIEEPRFPAKVVTLWKKYKRTVFVAASIAGITALFISGVISLATPKVSKETVVELGRRLEQTESKINRINTKLNAVETVAHFDRGGTGFLIDSKGYLLTNAHLVKGASQIVVQNPLGEYNARLIHMDNQVDLALLKIEDTSYHAFNGLPYGISKTGGDLGEDLFTLGYPRSEIVYNKGYLSAATGNRGDTAAFQMTIAANPGNSGSPVLNNDGEVIGIVTSSQENAQGMVFAIRSKNIFRAVDSIKADSSLQQADSSLVHLHMPLTSSIRGLERKQQIKRIEDYIYIVKIK